MITPEPIGPGSRFGYPRRSRHQGCLGCLGRIGLSLLFGVALMFAIYALLAPWTFYYGGHFHIIPGWNGWGRLHSTAAGGDYYMLLRIAPTTPGYRKSPIRGTAFLCTPRGERFRLSFGGSFLQKHGVDLRGVPIHLYMYNRPIFSSYFSADRNPRLDLYGAFGDSELVMEDHGSLANAFRPDGTPYGPADRNRARSKENVHVIFREGSPWELTPACPAGGQ